jgi:hypothetical protein
MFSGIDGFPCINKETGKMEFWTNGEISKDLNQYMRENIIWKNNFGDIKLIIPKDNITESDFLSTPDSIKAVNIAELSYDQYFIIKTKDICDIDTINTINKEVFELINNKKVFELIEEVPYYYETTNISLLNVRFSNKIRYKLIGSFKITSEKKPVNIPEYINEQFLQFIIKKFIPKDSNLWDQINKKIDQEINKKIAKQKLIGFIKDYKFIFVIIGGLILFGLIRLRHIPTKNKLNFRTLQDISILEGLKKCFITDKWWKTILNIIIFYLLVWLIIPFILSCIWAFFENNEDSVIRPIINVIIYFLFLFSWTLWSLPEHKRIATMFVLTVISIILFCLTSTMVEWVKGNNFNFKATINWVFYSKTE